jgi:hypothetical protein
VNFFSILTGLAVATLFYSTPANANLLAVGDSFTCAWDGRTNFPPQCWGENNEGQTEIPPEIRSPFSMGAGSAHACVIYYDGNAQGGRRTGCWGDKNNQYRQREVPPNQHKPLLLSVGRWHSCHLDEIEPGKTAPACWGRNDYGQSTVPENLRNATAIYASTQPSIHFSCALHDGASKLRCWGMINLEVDADQFPAIASGLPLQCEDRGVNGVNCWSNRPDGNPTNALLISYARTLRLNGGGLSSTDPAGQPEVLDFSPRRTREIALSRTHACSLDDYGLHCWGCLPGQTACRPHPELRFGPSLEGFGQGLIFLETLSEFLYEFDANFIRGVRQLMVLNSGPPAAYLLYSLRPFLTTIGYRALRQEYLDRAIISLDKLSGEATNNASFNLERRVRNSVAIQLLALSLRTATPVLVEKEKAMVLRLVGDMGNVQEEGILPRKTVDQLNAFFKSTAGNAYITGRIAMGQQLLAEVSHE